MIDVNLNTLHEGDVIVWDEVAGTCMGTWQRLRNEVERIERERKERSNRV